MLTVYSNQGSGNCYKVRLLLTQLELPFRVVEMDVVARDARKPEYLAKNPLGKTPFVELPDGTCLAESGAILHHFARGTALWPEDALEQTRVLQWMFWEQNVHEPTIAVARFWCHYLNAEAEYADKLIEKRDQGHNALAVMEQHLSDHNFFVAERYTIADIALYAYTHVAHEGGFDLGAYPSIRAWLERVSQQPRHIPITQVISG